MLPLWLQAAFWGLVGGTALVIGAAAGFWAKLPRRLVSGIMSFGAGVLISALAFELMDEAYQRGGVVPTGLGFLAGATVFTGASYALSARGAKHRKRSHRQPTESESPGSGLAIALGALLDGIPESIAIGVSLIEGGVVSWVTVAAVFLSNFPEGLSSAAGMRAAGRTAGYVFGVWSGIAVASSLAALAGYSVFSGLSPGVVAATLAVAAGAILAMLSDTMMPEAYEQTHDFAGLVTVFGFMVAFILSKIAG